jgi:hypothetical protein
MIYNIQYHLHTNGTKQSNSQLPVQPVPQIQARAEEGVGQAAARVCVRGVLDRN